MGKQYTEISNRLVEFINAQQMFFVGTATDDSRINISPKGMDSLRVLSKNRVIWLNVTGSGNESSAHVQENPRMTLMFIAYNGDPLILRLYGEARVVHQYDNNWAALYSHFSPTPGARQIFDLHVNLVQTSCGMGVPLYDYVDQRDMLTEWARRQGEDGVRNYWEKKNQFSLDGIPTHIVEKST